jgi:N-methylhydantoinase B
MGGLLAPLYPTLCHDITWNEGVLRPVSMLAPLGSVVNCRRPAPVSIATVAAVQAVNNVSLACISKMLACSESHAQEATAVWHGSHLCLYLDCRNQRGEQVIGSTTETFAGAGGARWGRDGIDVGGEIPNPIARMANVETNEAMFPIRYLFRQRARDSGGAGEFRGGTGGEYAIVPHRSADGGLGFVVSGKGVQFPMGHGLAGGYPGAPGRYAIVRGEAGAPRIAHGPQELSGPGEVVSWGVYALREGDALHVRWNGGGGIGDPMRRDAQAVVADLREGVIGPNAARAVYGVVFDAQQRVLQAQTQALRGRRGSARSPQSIRPGSCGSCGWRPAADANGQGFTLVDRLLHELGEVYHDASPARLREWLCPACGAQVDAQIGLEGDPVLADSLDQEPA